MANSGRKNQKHRHSRRRLAAISFLSNISLDGTHSDTKLAIYSRKTKRNLPKDDEENVEKEASSGSNKQLSREITNDTPAGKDLKQGKPKQAVEIVAPGAGPAKSVADGTPSNSSRADRNVDGTNNFSTGSKRWRTTSLSGDRDKQIAKKKLMHMLSDLGSKKEIAAEPVGERSRRSSSMSDNSSESVPKEVRFLSPDSQRPTSSGRVFFVSKERTPFAVCSILPFRKKISHRPDSGLEDLSRPRVRHTSGSRSISSSEGLLHMGLQVSGRVEEGQDVSYSRFLVPSRSRILQRANSEGGTAGGDAALHTLGHEVLRSISADACPTGVRGSHALDRVREEATENYNATILDDPELHSGSYRTLMTFPSYVVSVIDYVKPSVLKKELNEKFRDRFPNIQLTLSKLRSLKREMKRIAYAKCHLDQWSVAQAYVYFEKLIIKYLVNKQNRKLCAGACLLLSCKLSDVKGPDLTKLIETIEEVFKLNRKDLLNFELECLVALELCLHVPDSEVFPHYQRLLYNS